MKEIRRRPRVVGSFPDGYSAMMLVGARLRHISTTKMGNSTVHEHLQTLRSIRNAVYQNVAELCVFCGCPPVFGSNRT